MTSNNRPKISVFIATSIDGYIAKKNNDIDWLTQFSPPINENEDKDCGFSKFFSGVDALVMGKNTYNVVSHFDTWPYEGKRVVVLSSTLKSVCKQAELFTGEITDLVEKLYADGIKHIYVDGGATISQFLNMGLVDQLTISIIPVVLGSGIPLFSKINDDKWCRLMSSRVYSNGLIQLQYNVLKSTSND
jgi:dihydrofolate reductase